MLFTYWQMVWFAALVALPIFGLGMAIGEALSEPHPKGGYER